ncbi:hypothetical protein IFT68_23090 [Oxalobacteraceae sp. CFBP 13730]|nr:hypothetical protein [Oxalobacteraceae sp. CFBP 13730]
MTQHQTSSSELEVTLIPALDDSGKFSPEYQAVLIDFSRHTKPTSQTAYTMDAIDAGGGLIGEYAFKATAIILPAIAAASVAYISGRAGRKIKVKFGDVEVEAATIEQVEQAVKLMKKVVKG